MIVFFSTHLNKRRHGAGHGEAGQRALGFRGAVRYARCAQVRLYSFSRDRSLGRHHARRRTACTEKDRLHRRCQGRSGLSARIRASDRHLAGQQPRIPTTVPEAGNAIFSDLEQISDLHANCGAIPCAGQRELCPASTSTRLITFAGTPPTTV